MNANSARTRVECVVRAARRIQDSADALGCEARLRLLETTGLTRESIELVLAEHFETWPTGEEIDALLKSTTSAPVCHVIMSANVFTAALRALALAVATSVRVFVRVSRRDPVITELLVRTLAADEHFRTNGGSVAIVEEVHPQPGDELHVYGSDESITSIVAGLPAGVLVRAHGSGFGIAVVGKSAALDAAADALSRDIGVFDQRGCLSPRFVLVEGDEVRGERLAAGLHEALTRFSERYPRGLVDSGLRAEMSQYRAMLEAIGSYWEGSSHAVGFDPTPRALVLPPAARIAHVAAVDVENVGPLLKPWIRYVTATGVDGEGGLSRLLRECIPQARWSRLGWMQRPRLDGPVDGRTVLVETAGCAISGSPRFS